jgi:hypothetical protein
MALTHHPKRAGTPHACSSSHASDRVLRLLNRASDRDHLRLRDRDHDHGRDRCHVPFSRHADAHHRACDLSLRGRGHVHAHDRGPPLLSHWNLMY